MGKKSVAKNYTYNVIYQILVMFIPLITTPYVSRTLGAEAIGIYSYTLSIATYFALFGTLGISMYAQREIAYVQDDKKKRSILFWELTIVRFITMFFSMLIFYFLFASKGEYSLYYKILLIDLFGNCLEITWFFNGMEEFKKTVIRNGIIKWVCVILIFLLVKTPQDLIKYILIYSISTLLGQGSMWFYLPRYLQKVKMKQLKIVKHLKPIILLFIPQVAVQIYTVLDKTMIGNIVLDKSEVGFYEQAQKVIKLLLSVTTSLGTVMVPRMANVFASGNIERLKQYLKKSFNFVFFIAFPIIIGIISIANKFVPVFYGNGYDKVIILIISISPIILFMGLNNVTGMQFLLPTKRQKEYTISVIIGAIVNFTINILLIPNYGGVGASIATVISEFIVLSIQLHYMKDFIKIKELLNIAKKYAGLSIIMGIASYIIGLFIHSNIISIGVQAFVGAGIYVIGLILLKDEFMEMILQKFHLNFLIVKPKHK